MSEPAADHVDLDAGFEQVDGGGMPEGVWADAAPGSGIVEIGGVPAHDFVDPGAGERLAAGGKHGSLRRRRLWPGLQQLLDGSCGVLPERAGAPFVALAVQAHGRVIGEIEVPDPQVRCFLDACTGVVEE